LELSGDLQPGSIRIAGMPSERRSRGFRLFHMEKPEQYREFSEECERLAKQAKTERHRKMLREMAEVWRELAHSADKKT
jgi:hypothetical protein